MRKILYICRVVTYRFVYKLQDPYSFVDKVGEEEEGKEEEEEIRIQYGLTLNTHFL